MRSTTDRRVKNARAFNERPISGRMDVCRAPSAAWMATAGEEHGETRMTCASCGKHIPAGARYCVHCGAEQSPPTPSGAVASMARASRLRAANAAHAEPRARLRVDAANQSSATPAGHASAPVLPAQETGTPPAYATGPARRGLAVALVGGGIVVALAAAAGWRLHESGPDGIVGNDARQRAASTQISVDASTGGASTIAASGAGVAGAALPSIPVTDDGAVRPVDSVPAPPTSTDTSASAGSAPPSREPPIEIKALPPRPAFARTDRRAAAERSSPPETPAAAPPEVPKPPDNRALASASARATAVSTVADHWRRMDDELSRCTREDFITRVICGQRVRFRYCDGYWGKVGQCAANPAPERGQ